MVFKSLRDGEAFFKLASLRDGEAFFKLASLRWIYIVFKYLRDGEAFHKLASLRDYEAFFKLASLEMDTCFSSLLEMVMFFQARISRDSEAFSSLHLWRWIHGLQVPERC